MTEADRIAVGLVGFGAWKSSSAFEGAYLDPVVIERVSGEVETFALQTQCDVAIVEIDGILVGWGACEGDADYISDIWIDPDFQGRGIGRAIVDHFLDQMRSSHIPVAKIATHAQNINAIRLYERCGFHIVWRGPQWSETMQVELQKVRLEKVF
ncbi:MULTISPECIES: GNAT family N-acetyltransferase [unclassified Rhizobium]|uniref:GNAT family N-acetyltransferase n=1 Tax=unclassified Rhizobium TaxID=2613769 RepID=UPI00177C4B4A|nr:MULTISPECIES: GNAT family N-acetyltransferase [unclassified Rhizobium]MBD8689215.1 GNAT family N-acetyltransferase [Rhizobium sp. CFBP 13644]MBD8693239.1 GNAT family N-acetyltransferase [Rhizobium sp. CFBP 13717]